ncbi:unnamed protein product [Soboliphyme baturini]|uniref:Neur_chan_LBD domain-containing protein n=1 Tax=Soboliphyme baturini TaxID=241478 RepID=A0A183J413_9BILA|nr:unnamed protein product [Soboliphyme baturini]
MLLMVRCVNAWISGKGGFIGRFIVSTDQSRGQPGQRQEHNTVALSHTLADCNRQCAIERQSPLSVMAVKGERFRSCDAQVIRSSVLGMLLATSLLRSAGGTVGNLSQACTESSQSFSLVEFLVSENETVSARASIFEGGARSPSNMDISLIDAYFNRLDGSYSPKRPDWFIELAYTPTARLGVLIFDRKYFTNVVKIKPFDLSRSSRFRETSNDCLTPNWEYDPLYTNTDLCYLSLLPLRVGRCPTGKGLPGTSVCGSLKKSIPADDCVSISLAFVSVHCIGKLNCTFVNCWEYR